MLNVHPIEIDAPEAPASPALAQAIPAMLDRGPSIADRLPIGYFIGAASLMLCLAAWYLASLCRLDLYVRFINIPGPDVVFRELFVMGKTAAFYHNVAVSLWRILAGFLIATGLGITMGVAIAKNRSLKSALFPPLEVLRPIPAIAWVPISIMLWPTAESSIIFITFIGAFFPIVLNTMHGVASVDKSLIRAAKCLGASEVALLRYVVLPGAMPEIFTGLTVGMGVSWVSVISAEMISGQFGIGYFTWEAYSLIQYPDIVVGMVVIGVLGLLCSGAIRTVGRLCMPWLTIQHGSSSNGVR